MSISSYENHPLNRITILKRRYFIFNVCLSALFLWTSCQSVEGPKSQSIPDVFTYAKRLYDAGQFPDAILEFQRLTYSTRATEFEDDVQFFLGMSYFRNGQFLLASDAFQTLMRNVPGSPFTRQAFFGVGSCYFNLSPVYSLDQEYTRRAIMQYQTFLETYPPPDSVKINEEIENLKTLSIATEDSIRKSRYTDLINRLQSQLGQLDTLRLAEERIRLCRSKLARKQFETAQQYIQLRSFRSATIYYDEVMTSFSDSEYYEPALLGKIEMLIFRRRWQEALVEIEKYEDRFPSKKEAVSASRKIAEQMEGTGLQAASGQ